MHRQRDLDAKCLASGLLARSSACTTNICQVKYIWQQETFTSNCCFIQVRTTIAQGSGIEAVVLLMQNFEAESGLLCNACLCLMSLVRGEGPACEVITFLTPAARSVFLFISCLLMSLIRLAT